MIDETVNLKSKNKIQANTGLAWAIKAIYKSTRCKPRLKIENLRTL